VEKPCHSQQKSPEEKGVREEKGEKGVRVIFIDMNMQ